MSAAALLLGRGLTASRRPALGGLEQDASWEYGSDMSITWETRFPNCRDEDGDGIGASADGPCLARFTPAHFLPKPLVLAFGSYLLSRIEVPRRGGTWGGDKN